MNRTQGNMYHMHRDTWVRHIRKLRQDPEINRFSGCRDRLENDGRTPRATSRWERRFQG